MPTLIRPPSIVDFDAVDRRFRRMLEAVGFAPTLVPAADIYETGEEWVAELEIPGYEQKELTLEVSDHSLTVKGMREQPAESKDKSFRLHERLEREFERRFELPSIVETAKLTASFKQGVLELHAPKAEEVAPKKIPIAIT